MWYNPKNGKIGSYPAIANKVTGELALVGKYGEIWEAGIDKYKAVVTSARIANKERPNLEVPYKSGEEAVFSFPKEKLDYFVKLLKVPNNRNSMVKRANSF